MNKIHCASQNMEAKTLPADFVSLVDFHLLLFTQLTADLTLEWSGRSMFHLLSHLFMQKLLFVALKQLQTTPWIVDMLLFLINWANVQSLWTQPSHWQMFIQNGEYTAFWYLQLLCYLMQLQFTISQNEFVVLFLVFPGTAAEFGHSASFLSVQPHLKSAYHHLTIVSNGAEFK